MSRTEFLNRIDNLLEVEPGTLTGGERLENLEGWNSLSVIGFMALANDEFGTVLSPRKIADCRTVGDLVTLVIPE